MNPDQSIQEGVGLSLTRRERRRKSPYGGHRTSSLEAEHRGQAANPSRLSLVKMGITTRSMTSQREADERRQFLEQGAAAARAAAHVEQLPGPQGAQPQQPMPPADAGAALAQTEPRVQHPDTETDIQKLSIFNLNRTFNLESRQSPRVESADGAVLRERSHRPLPIPLEPTVMVHNPRQQVTFSGVNERAASIHSRASSRSEARRKEAELEASERLAELRRQELHLEAELVRKRLETRLSQIDAEGSRKGSSVSGNSVRVKEWLNNYQHRGDLAPEKERPPDYFATPKRPVDRDFIVPERRMRHRSSSREERNRPLSPSARRHTHTPFTNHTQESNIAESMLNIFEKMQMAARPAPKDIYELPLFYGDVSEWRSFFNTYSETSKRYIFTDYENVARLRTALRGEAKACVQHVLSTATRPDLIMKILKKQFGRSEVLLDRAIEDLRRLQPVGPSAHELNSFAIKVTNIVSTVIDIDRRHYADNPMLIREITDKLSPHLRSRWCEYARVREHEQEPEIQQLADFLMTESEQEMRFCHSRAGPAVRSRAAGARQDAPAHVAGARDTAGASAAGNRPFTAQRAKVIPTQTRGATGNRYTYATNTALSNCLFCGGRHVTTDCRKLTSKSLGERWDWAKLNTICFKCLNAKHRRGQCKASGCGIAGCTHPHHTLLHEIKETGNQFQVAATVSVPPPSLREPPRAEEPLRLAEPRRPSATPPEASRPHTPDARIYTSVTSHHVLLKVLPVTLSGPNGTVHIFAMLDDCSTISLLEQDIAEAIGARGPESPLSVRGIGNIAHRAYTQTVKAIVRPARGGEAHELTLRTVSGLGLRSQTLNKEQLMRYEHLQDLEEACYTTGVPQMLIGADHWHLLVPSEIRQGRRDEPAAMKLPLGWAFFGLMPRVVHTNDQVTMHCHADPDDRFDEEMKRHWAIEALGVSAKDHVKPTDKRAIEIFEKTVRKVRNRYEVGQLWVADDVALPPSYSMAHSRLKNLESKMDRDPEFAQEYEKQIENLLEKGYADRVVNVPNSKKAWFLPHFSVLNLNKGKRRAVFDCAARSQGHALNDYILQGPDLLKNLIGILLRFREERYAVTADIQEMFLRIQMRPEDQASQLFLWRGARRDCVPKVYKLNRVCFGSVSSPFLAHAVRNRNADDNKEAYPEAVYEIHENHYMDDFVSSFRTEEDLIRVTNQVRESHAEAGFILRSYASNNERLLASIEPDLHAIGPTELGDKQQKVLGMTWDPATDTLGYNTKLLRVRDDVKAYERAPTKRELLSIIMSIYDPLGLIAHFVITAKILYQRVWFKGTSWDEPLPTEEAVLFFKWLHALRSVTDLRIPRHYIVVTNARYDLHAFVDASTEAYCAAVYWRAVDQYTEEIKVSLAAAKSRVGPLKLLTVPRLELSAAVLGLRLAQTVASEQRYNINTITYWTDSRTVYGWVRDDARQYNPFVSHCLAEIAEASNKHEWRWLPTKFNPADAGTRCKPERRISIEDEWYQGPPFLRRSEDDWPREPEGTIQIETLPERRGTTETVAATTSALHKTDPTSVLPDISRFSSYDRLVNATGYVLLFIEKLKTRNRSLQLQVRHLHRAEHMWALWSQQRSFPAELQALTKGENIDIKSRLYKLAPELADDGLLKMHTRLGNAPIAYTNIQPVILDGRDPFVKLLIAREHRRSAHIHNEAVVNTLRCRYWILHLRPAVKAVARACALCQVRRANPRAQPFGDLPPERLQPFQRPFTNSAVDYMEPLTVTVGRRHEKRWVALFTCLVTRAVHLEIVNSLSSDSSILALRRFAARRGWPRVMWSDNGTCFRAADNELRAAYQAWLPELQQHSVHHRMIWKFIPPGNPSAGGAWERMVRTVKTALAQVLHTRTPKEELLTTLLAEIEAIVNNRPLTHVPVGADEPEALTPAHFLLRFSTDLPNLRHDDDPNERKMWKTTQALADHFWRRWVKEYLPLLAPRQSSNNGGRQIQIGDVVIVADPNSPRNTWPRGLVVATHPGPDQRTRSVDVKTAHGILRRPTCRLAIVASQPLQLESATGGQC